MWHYTILGSWCQCPLFLLEQKGGGKDDESISPPGRHKLLCLNLCCYVKLANNYWNSVGTFVIAMPKEWIHRDYANKTFWIPVRKILLPVSYWFHGRGTAHRLHWMEASAEFQLTLSLSLSLNWWTVFACKPNNQIVTKVLNLLIVRISIQAMCSCSQPTMWNFKSTKGVPHWWDSFFYIYWRHEDEADSISNV